MMELDTTARIHAPGDDPLNGTTAVRVMFTVHDQFGYVYGEPSIYGIFRLDTDAEIDFDDLPQDEQDILTLACETLIKTKQKEYPHEKLV